jgi:hypothetical protein
MDEQYRPTILGRLIYVVFAVGGGAIGVFVLWIRIVNGQGPFGAIVDLLFGGLVCLGAVACVGEAVRSSPRFVLGENGISYRGLLSQTHIRWADVESYSVRYLRSHVFLHLRLRTGKSKRFPLSGLKYRQFMESFEQQIKRYRLSDAPNTRAS